MADWDKWREGRDARSKAVREQYWNDVKLLTKTPEIIDVMENTIDGLVKLSKHLNEMDLTDYRFCEECGRKGLSPQQIGQTMAYGGKLVDQFFRMLEFARGEADHRTEVVGLKDLFPLLTDDTVKQVVKELEEKAPELLQ